MQPYALTFHQARSYSGLGDTKLYELIKAGKIDARKEGRRTLILADSLRQHLDSLPRVEAA